MTACVGRAYDVAAAISTDTRSKLSLGLAFADPRRRWTKIVRGRVRSGALDAVREAAAELAGHRRRAVREAAGELVGAVEDLARFVPEFTPAGGLYYLDRESVARLDALRSRARSVFARLRSLTETDPAARLVRAIQETAAEVLPPARGGRVKAWAAGFDEVETVAG